MKPDVGSVRLAVLVADGVSRLPFETLVREVVAGGADMIQLREKNLPDSILLEHALLCRAVNGRTRLLVPATLHPNYRQVLETYLANVPLALETVPHTPAPEHVAPAHRVS